MSSLGFGGVAGAPSGVAQARACVGYQLDGFGKPMVTGGGAVAVLVLACMIISTVAELAMVGWLRVVGIKASVATGQPPEATA